MADPTTFAAIGAACSAIIAALTVLGFWIRFSDRLTKAEGAAAAALLRAAEAHKLCEEAHTRITALAAEFGMYRENVAREYIHRATMREIEDRLTNAINRLADRLDRVLELKTG